MEELCDDVRIPTSKPPRITKTGVFISGKGTTCHFLKNMKFLFGSGEFGNLIWDNGLSRKEVVLYLSRHYLWARYIVAR